MTMASAAATLPHRRLVNISPAAMAPTRVAWSLGIGTKVPIDRVLCDVLLRVCICTPQGG
jgi:hypothetical protein